MDEPKPADAPDRGDQMTRGYVPADAGAPTESLVSAAVGDRCVNCGSPLSSDQRYCVVCGERRGAPRFTLPAADGAAPDAASVATPARAPRSGLRFGMGTVIAGVATLLLAMLVGVLIGHNAAGNATRTVASAPVRIIKVGGGSSAPAASTSGSGSGASTGASAAKRSHRSSKAKPTKAKSAATTKKTVAKEQSAAKKVLGGSGTPAATVTVGQSGSGKGYNKKTHKFDGSFFGQ